MMPIEPAALRQARKREVTGKSSSNCKTCRTKGVICNGNKPSCIHCTSKGQICQEYRYSPNPSPPSRSSSPSSRHFVNITTAPSASSGLFTTPQEHRSFTFFCQYTVPQISSAFSDDFWNRLVLQATHHEPAIKHAAIAFGALHERFTLHDGSMSKKDGNEEDDNFPLSQYKDHLQTLLSQHPVLHQLDDFRDSIYTPLNAPPHLHPPRDEAGTVTFGQKRQLVSSAYDFGSDGYEEDIPSTFTSIEEARNSLEYIRTVGAQAPRTFFSIEEARNVDSLEHFHATNIRVHSIPTSYSPLEAAKVEVTVELIRSSAALRLRQWSSAFDSFLASRPTPTNVDEPMIQSSILLVQIHKLVMELSFKIDYWRAVHDEMVWDELLPEWAEIIELAEQSQTTTSTRTRNKLYYNQKEVVFNLDVGLVVPLSFVAGKCRDQGIRRRAIALLRASERQEGVSNSVMVAQIAERLVEIEEDGLLDREGQEGGPEFVLRERRVSGVEIRFEGEEQRAWLRYLKIGEGLEGSVMAVEEWVEW